MTKGRNPWKGFRPVFLIRQSGNYLKSAQIAASVSAGFLNAKVTGLYESSDRTMAPTTFPAFVPPNEHLSAGQVLTAHLFRRVGRQEQLPECPLRLG